MNCLIANWPVLLGSLVLVGVVMFIFGVYCVHFRVKWVFKEEIEQIRRHSSRTNVKEEKCFYDSFALRLTYMKKRIEDG